MNFMFLNDSWDFTLANFDAVWKVLCQVGLLLIFLLIGNILRNKVPLFKRCLIPSALIGGLLLLIVDLICKWCGVILVDNRVMQIITYHGLGIGFAAMTLKTNKKDKSLDKGQCLDNGLLTAGTYLLQGFVGLGITMVLFLITEHSQDVISYVCGIILPLGFGQGPGNALTWDINYTNLPEALFHGNGSFGLSIASIGFIVASVIGIIYINIFKKKGLIEIREVKNQKEFIDHTNPDGNEIPDNESVDKFSIQVGFVTLAYAIAFGIMCLLSFNSFTNSVAWGFNFIWAAGAAVAIKLVLKFLKKKNVMKREYINNYSMDRISGFAFDLMIVAGVAAIQIDDVRRYIVPIVILCVVGTLITYAYIRIVAKSKFSAFQHEFFVMTFGTLTGTASNGMILLKEIDPNLETPVANMYIVSTFPAMIFTIPLLLLLNFAATSFTNAGITFGILFALWLSYTLFIFRHKLKRKPKKEIVKE